MTVSVVLRLVEQALDTGRLAGEVELVATGERTVVQSAEELVAFVQGSTSLPRGPTVEHATRRGRSDAV